MRITRLFTVVLVIITAGLLLAPPAGAQPPFRLPKYVTDNAGTLSESGRTAITSAIDKLYEDRQIRLWVVYVDDFSGQSAVNWAQRTMRASELGDYDALLAVATTSRAYAFLVPSTLPGVSESHVDNLRHNQIEPALRNGDWSGAAVAAANGLNRSSSASGRVMLLVALGVITAAVVVLLVVMRYRRRRWRAAALAAARQVDPTDTNALAAVPLEALDDLSRSMVVEVDNALRTSSNELAVAVDEFGDDRTEPFTKAVLNAKAALSQAFTVRHQLDDGTPLTAAQRRQLLTQAIVSAARADRELESQTEAFETLRDLVINAPSRLNGLTEQYVELTARISPAEQRLAELHNEFAPAALASVSGNVAAAKERLTFADRNVSSARDLAARPASGQQTGLVDAVRAAEAALGQARALLDAVDNAASDIRHAVAALPTVADDIQSGIMRTNEQLHKAQHAKSLHTGELVAARDAAARALDGARGAGSADPLAAFAQLTTANADLNRLLDTLAEEQTAADRLSRSFEQALFTAQARVGAVSDYIDTRRGSIGPEARTRLAEAKRQLETALEKKTTNLTEAIAYANAASTLAANAQSLANADVQSAQRAYTRRAGGDAGAMIGGIIIGDLLSGGLRGRMGMDGWIPTSFGGSSDGGLIGGGGRF
ncbi:TPM domain-containing protein [Mycobacterium haemophilum]|uniref:Membrane protein n=1 Tax=Mycobacterium haemophilum TaxID=29311 RepID=A0A0I9TPH1_9MYCO|nr:TPM domain-containing protein [Mycobacterium haemophilum]KLO30315.1 membrane protein [Mycobacterium haemophilum]KLO37344.1 membrane protein [Mycobacterium haemophilum]KLO43893.1 membrane protein [Mycobacterium haemophilum]KLO49688.1 membrane protein [Mycobacterium haemophilum]